MTVCTAYSRLGVFLLEKKPSVLGTLPLFYPAQTVSLYQIPTCYYIHTGLIRVEENRPWHTLKPWEASQKTHWCVLHCSFAIITIFWNKLKKKKPTGYRVRADFLASNYPLPWNCPNSVFFPKMEAELRQSSPPPRKPLQASLRDTPPPLPAPPGHTGDSTTDSKQARVSSVGGGQKAQEYFSS